MTKRLRIKRKIAPPGKNFNRCQKEVWPATPTKGRVRTVLISESKRPPGQQERKLLSGTHSEKKKTAMVAKKEKDFS